MSARFALVLVFVCRGFGLLAAPEIQFSGERKLNNLVSELLNVASMSGSSGPIQFTRPVAGWIFLSADVAGTGTVRILLDKDSAPILVQDHPGHAEAVRHVAAGAHELQVVPGGDVRITKLTVKAIRELIHCGLGFDPAIKSYGVYDMEFLRRDILPNITTLVIPSGIQLPEPVITHWRRQGKHFIAEAGIDPHARSAGDHANYWTGILDRVPFADGILINEFIVNRPVSEWVPVMTPERQARMDAERAQYGFYAEALRKIRADPRYAAKTIYGYVGGSGKRLNQEVIGTNFIRTLIDCDYRVALERYLHEMSSERGSEQALETFLDGIADWEAREPGVTRKMVIAFGLFSMPPGGINKQPNVDYHVWMDRQMNLVANHPTLSGLAGLEWWTSTLADEETVRFVGRLYRHYAIDGRTNLLTRDPLFLTHIDNADFERGTQGWTLLPAEEGSLQPKSFPRYGRIEGRFMGLGRPADPEHIGDTFLWMKRSPKGPNSFSQVIRNLEPGRLYSMKMLTCDYRDLVAPRKKARSEAFPFTGSVVLEGVTVDAKRSFEEMYASSPEPDIPVWITYHWKVFRADAPTAKLIVSDWTVPHTGKDDTFGQEQIFNFLEIQPYWE